MPAAQHRKFDDGINQDVASFLLGEGYVYSSKSMLYDKIGIARKRGGIGGIGATTTYRGDHMGALLKDDGTSQLYSLGYNGANPIIDAINSTTGVFTSIGASGAAEPLVDGGRPFQHYGFLIWPMFSTNPAIFSIGINAVGGATGAVASYSFVSAGSVVLTAGSKRVTCAAGDNPLVNMQVGQIFVAFAVGLAQAYIGRVTRLVSSTAFDVYPTPAAGFTAAAGGASSNNYSWSGLPQPYATLATYITGKVGMSFQGRVLLGACNRYDPTTAVATNEFYPRRVYFTSTLLEGSSVWGANRTLGAVFLNNDGFAPLNFFDIPAQEEITAMAPTGFGDAVFFSAFRAFRLTGNLSTQFGTEQSFTWAVREIPNSVGCLSERSLQRTPRGLIFAHDSGIYATDGSSMQPLMYKRVQDLWKGLVAGAGFKIYGSALIRGNHYYICGTSGGVLWGLMVNLDTLAWAPMAGKTTSPASWIINSGVQDPANPSRVFGLKWWNQGGSIPSMTGGQLLKLEDAFNPSSANRADSDGTTVGLEIVTRPYTEDSPTVQKVFMGATIEYENLGGAGIGVTPFFNLDAAEIPATGVTTALPRQDSYAVTAGTNAAPIVLTIGAGHNITQGAWVRVIGVLGLTKANGLWRVGAVTGTTITLLGSVGNAAYTSGGTVTCVDSRDISLLNAVTAAGQDPAAVVYRINDTDLGGAAGADSFELYGITHTWETRELHEQ